MTRLKLAAGETFASLRIRNFRLFFIGQSISQIGNWLSLIAQTLLVLKLTHSGTALGVLTAAQFAPVLLLGAFAGLVADRSDKRRLLVTTQSLAMLQSFALAALAILDRPPVAAIFGVAFVGGIITAFDNPARRSFVVEMVPIDHVNNAVSLNSALMTGSRIVGPALAGLLVATVGFRWTFFVDGMSYIAVIAGLLMMRPGELRAAPVVAKAKGQVREGLRYARSELVLWVPLVMMALVGTFAFNYSVTFPVFVTKTLGGTDTTFTILFSWLSVGSLIGALAVARRATTSVRFVALSSVAFGVSMVAVALAPNELLAFVIAPLVGPRAALSIVPPRIERAGAAIAGSYLLEMPADAASVESITTLLSDRLKGEVRLEVLPESVEAPLADDAESLTWWTQPPQHWAPRAAVPLVIEERE